MILPLITDIQKYSIHDGPGIRTTVFFKGCPLKCEWCHNPETQNYQEEFFWDPEKCTFCRSCMDHCCEKAICVDENVVKTNLAKCSSCNNCIEYCYQGARELCGFQLSPKELVKELIKDQIFYEESGGGVTLSGGEVMTMDITYLLEIIKPLSEKGINLGIDTCGYADWTHFQQILPYVDFFLYDCKIINNEKHIQYTGVSNELILENLIKLSENHCKIYLRMPVIQDVNATKENINETIVFLKEKSIIIEEINLLPYHNMGNSKYKRLGKSNPGKNLKKPENKTLEEFAALFKSNGFQVTIN